MVKIEYPHATKKRKFTKQHETLIVDVHFISIPITDTDVLFMCVSFLCIRIRFRIRIVW